jgi:hypothetical protein
MAIYQQSFRGLTSAFEAATRFPEVSALDNFLREHSDEHTSEVHNAYQWNELLTATSEAFLDDNQTEYRVLAAYNDLTFFKKEEKLIQFQFESNANLPILVTVWTAESAVVTPVGWHRSPDTIYRHGGHVSDVLTYGQQQSNEVAAFIRTLTRNSSTFRRNYEASPYVTLGEFGVSLTELSGSNAATEYKVAIENGKYIVSDASGKTVFYLARSASGEFIIHIPSTRPNIELSWNKIG